jgi:hypothetical protein
MRADSYEASGIENKVDANGYLRIKGTFTRAGLFKYRNPDGSMRVELRHPDDVIRADSVNTLKLVPVAPMLDHTLTMEGLQKPNDTDKFKPIGVTGENIVTTSDAALDGSLTIHDKKTITGLLEAGKKNKMPEISAAYTLPNGLDETPGYFDGSKWGIESGNYDARQKPPFHYGHISLVEKGRAGSRCQTRADAAQNSNKKEEKTMGKRNVPELVVKRGDSIVFRADAREVDNSDGVDALLADRSKLSDIVKAEMSRADAAEGELSVLKKDHEELKKAAKDGIPREQYRADMEQSLTLIEQLKEIGVDILKEEKADLSPKSLSLRIIKTVYPKEEIRADISDSEVVGLMKGINNDWPHRVSRLKTDAGIKHFKDNPVDLPKNAAGLIRPMGMN